MRLIDGEALYKSLADLYKERGFNDREIHFSLKDMEMNINGAPAVDVVLNFTGVDVRHGHWIEIDRGLLWQCSECEHHSISGGHYCDWCGAKMDEVQDEID